MPWHFLLTTILHAWPLKVHARKEASWDWKGYHIQLLRRKWPLQLSQLYVRPLFDGLWNNEHVHDFCLALSSPLSKGAETTSRWAWPRYVQWLPWSVVGWDYINSHFSGGSIKISPGWRQAQSAIFGGVSYWTPTPQRHCTLLCPTLGDRRHGVQRVQHSQAHSHHLQPIRDHERSGQLCQSWPVRSGKVLGGWQVPTGSQDDCFWPGKTRVFGQNSGKARNFPFDGQLVAPLLVWTRNWAFTWSWRRHHWHHQKP